MFTNEEIIPKLMTINSFLLVWPSSHSKNLDISRIIICSSYIIISMSSFFYFSIKRHGNLSLMIFSILDQITHTVFHFSTMTICLHINLFKTKQHSMLFEKMNKLRSDLQNDWYESKSLSWIFFIFLGYVIIGLCYNVYVWVINFGLKGYLYFHLKEVEFFQWTLNSIFMCLCILSIKHMFNELNNKIARRMQHKLQGNMILSEIGTMMVNYDGIHKVDKQISGSYVPLYYEICKLVKEFNEVFGLNFLLLVIICIVELLFSAGFCAIYGLKSGIVVDEFFFDTKLLIGRLFRISMLLIVPVMLAYSCECVESEATKIIPISLFYLNELSPQPKSSWEQALKEELTSLYEEGCSRSPIFTAADFFPVNYAMLGFIVGSVTSYTIVMMQLISD